MVETEEEFRAWLEGQPREVCVAIAARAALRALPQSVDIISHWNLLDSRLLEKAKLTGLPLLELRAMIVSAAWAQSASIGIQNMARDAAKAADKLAGSPHTGNRELSLLIAGAAARAAAFSKVASDLTMNAITMAWELEEPPLGSASISEAYQDADGDASAIMARPLWSGQTIPPHQRQMWEKFRDGTTPDSPWAFWKTWYQGFLDGKPLDWELQRQIALIPSEDWDMGIEHIARLIADIQAQFLAAKAPLAETVEFNPETNRFRVVPIPIVNPALLGNTLAQIADALDDALAEPANGLQENSRETRVLRRTLSRYANDPQRIEMDLVSVAIGLRHQVEVSQDLPASPAIMALREVVEQGALSIRATHPDVAQNRAVIAAQSLRELSPADKQLLADALPMLEAISEGGMAEDFRTDIPALVNDAIGWPVNHAPKLPGVDESERISSRVAKVSLAVKSAAVMQKIEGSTGYKAVRIGLTLKSVIDIFVRCWGVIQPWIDPWLK